MNKTVKICSLVVLALATIFLAYACVDSVITPIHFENTRAARQDAIVKNLSAIRTAEREFCLQNGRYMADLDSLVLFIKNGTKKELFKQGALTEKNLSDGWNDEKAVKAIQKAQKTGNWKEIDAAGISHDFRRDTITTPLLTALFKDEYTEETIGEIIYIPYTDHALFEVNTNDNYYTSQGIHVPLIEVVAPYAIYMADEDQQELININHSEASIIMERRNIDRASTPVNEFLKEYHPGPRFGSTFEPNNLAGDWE